VEPEVEFRCQGAFFRFRFGGISLPPLRHLRQIWRLHRKWGPATCRVCIRPSRKLKMAHSGHLVLLKLLLLGRRLSDFAEILCGDTYDGPQKMAGDEVGTRSRIVPVGGVFSNSVLLAYLRCRSRYLHQILCVRRQWGPATCGIAQIRLF